MVTELQLAALTVYDEECAAHGPGRIIQAVKALRDRGGAVALKDAVDAVRWAADRPLASSLPMGTVVADDRRAYIKTGDPHPHYGWQGTGETFADDAKIDSLLREYGGQILRVGLGGQQ